MAHHPEGLLIERDRLLNAVLHLERSNGELKEFIKESGHDPDLRQAVGENIVVIAKYKGQIEQLEQEIRKGMGIPTETACQQAVALRGDGAGMEEEAGRGAYM